VTKEGVAVRYVPLTQASNICLLVSASRARCKMNNKCQLTDDQYTTNDVLRVERHSTTLLYHATNSKQTSDPFHNSPSDIASLSNSLQPHKTSFLLALWARAPHSTWIPATTHAVVDILTSGQHPQALPDNLFPPTSTEQTST